MWRNLSVGNNIMHMVLIENGSATNNRFIVGLKGAITGDGVKITEFTGDVKTLENENGTQEVVKTELKDGELVIVTKSNQKYVIYNLGPNGGLIRKVD